MPQLGVQFGTSKTGLNTCVIRDIDVSTPRPRLPPRALPDDIRQKLGFSRSKTEESGNQEEEKRPLPLVIRQSMGGTLPKQALGVNQSRTNEMLPPRHSLGGTMNMYSSNKGGGGFGKPTESLSGSSTFSNARLSLGGGITKNQPPKLIAALNNTDGPSMKEKPRRLRM